MLKKTTYCWEWKYEDMPMFLICSAANRVSHPSGTSVFSKVDWVLFGFVSSEGFDYSLRSALTSLGAIRDYCQNTFQLVPNQHAEVAVVRFHCDDLVIPTPLFDPDTFQISDQVKKAGLIRVMEKMLA